MKLKIFILSLLILCTMHLNALDASISFSRFYPQEGSYIEVNINIIGNTLTIIPGNQTGAEILITLSQNGQIELFNKYNLLSPKDANISVLDLMDVQRFGLKNGKYNLKVVMTDLNDSSKTLEYHDIVNMEKNTHIQLSDITVLSKVSNVANEDNLTKNGVRMEPLAFNYAHQEIKNLIFYTELYNSDQDLDQDFFAQYRLYEANSLSKEEEVKIESFKKLSPNKLIPLLLQFDISNIPSGNYILAVQIKNKNKELLVEEQTQILRSNPNLEKFEKEIAKEEFNTSFVQLLDESKLDYYLRAMAPIVSVDQTYTLKELVRSDKVKSKRYFIYNYWVNYNKEAPELAFQKYIEVANVVNDSYQSGFGYGFETDRGHMFLKYGMPDDKIAVEEEPSAPPYEIWLYDKIDATNQRRVKFLFYNPSLAPNDFRLLHSTCRGERNNPAWEVELYRDAVSEQGDVTIDTQHMGDNFNRNARRYFDNL